MLLTFGYIYLFFFLVGRCGGGGGSTEGRRPAAGHCGGGVMAEPPSSSLTEFCVLEQPRCNMDKWREKRQERVGEIQMFNYFKKQRDIKLNLFCDKAQMVH